MEGLDKELVCLSMRVRLCVCVGVCAWVSACSFKVLSSPKEQKPSLILWMCILFMCIYTQVNVSSTNVESFVTGTTLL